MQRAMPFAAQPRCQPSTATANAGWLLVAKLLEKIGSLRIVAVFNRPIEQKFGFWTIAGGTTVDERDRKMILSFLSAVHCRVVASNCPPVGPDGCGRGTASPYSVLKAVTDLEPCIAIVRASRTAPPLKSSPEVPQFAVCGGDVVRCGRVSETKLVLQLADLESTSTQITHVLPFARSNDHEMSCGRERPSPFPCYAAGCEEDVVPLCARQEPRVQAIDVRELYSGERLRPRGSKDQD